MAHTWTDALKSKLIKAHGNKVGSALLLKYERAFPSGYAEECTPTLAFNDITCLEQLSGKNLLQLNFYYAEDKSLHLRMYKWLKSIPLSDLLPMFDNMGLRIDSENGHKLTLAENQTLWISDFVIIHPFANFDIAKIAALFQEAFIKIYYGLSENDGFNKLVLGANLAWHEIMILRAYAKYLRQIGFRFSQTYIEKALINHAGLAKNLVQLFLVMHNPKTSKHNVKEVKKVEQLILHALDNVTSLDEDRIIRALLTLIQSTLRTNYFKFEADGHPKEYLSIKLNSRLLPDMPLPIPLYEIFVYSPRFEGIHLRNTKVARGGIRWSDRPEDFRTEILGLMKAQTVKNAIIVPSGAKGGFVLKALLPEATRESRQKEVVNCYKTFICGLLDITDNIVNKKIISPPKVVCYDDHDYYLVVAADKGTTSFSDIANAISKDYHFWLGDAFASGGKTGYDHKKMGITARGAWESIKRHFRELHINPEKVPVTVVGIGDMSGDVFGNGMLYSKQLKLVAAFDHRHIFIDPNPEPLIAYQERLRLFKLPTSSWAEYNPK